MKPRIYNEIVSHSLKNFRQMVFLSGPRQVKVGVDCGLDRVHAEMPVVAFGENVSFSIAVN